MTNDELQTAIDALLGYLLNAVGNSPIIIPADALKELLNTQIERGKNDH